MTGQWCAAGGIKGQSPAHGRRQLLKDHLSSGTPAGISLSLCWDHFALHPLPLPRLPPFLHVWSWGPPWYISRMQVCVSKSVSQRTYKTSSFFSILKGINEVSYQNTISLKRILWFFQGSCTDVRVGPSRRLSTEKLMLFNCGAGVDSWESLGQQGDQTSQF